MSYIILTNAQAIILAIIIIIAIIKYLMPMAHGVKSIY